jgi:hypothetical protein
MFGLPRRQFLLGAGAVLLTACGGSDGDDTTAGDTSSTRDDPGTTGSTGGLVLGFAFNPNGFLVAGRPQRTSAVLFESSGGFATVEAAPEELSLVATPAGGGEAVNATVARHGEDLDRPYYPAELTFPTPGVWEVVADLGDGTTLRREVQVSESVPFPQIGDPLPAVPTPTVADPLGVSTICTRSPACPFHEVSLTDALTQGRPVAVLLSTPAYCQVAVCGPVLDLLVEAHPQTHAVIHVEVFPNGSGTDPGTPSPVLTEGFHLDFEPVLYVAGADGTITSRLDSIYDGDELTAALT